METPKNDTISTQKDKQTISQIQQKNITEFYHISDQVM